MIGQVPKKSRPSQAGLSWGQIFGGLLMVGAGIGLGVVFGYQPVATGPSVESVPPEKSKSPAPVPPAPLIKLPFAPTPSSQTSSVSVPTPTVPDPQDSDLNAPSQLDAPPSPDLSQSNTVTPAPVPAPVPAPAPAPAPPSLVGALGGEEPGPAPDGTLTAAEVPSLDIAALPPALAVAPGTTATLPLDGAVELTALGLSPPAKPSVEAAGEKPPWLRNAVPFALPAALPMVALVFDDLGMDRRRTERVIGFPGPLTLSFLPYAGDLPRQTRAAHAAGHELMVHMPMEPLASGLDPGPGVLLTGLSADENLHRLDHGLAAFDGYVGLNNHMGSRFTMDRAAMAPILAELHRRGLLFLDSVTIPSTVGSELAASINLPHTQRNVFLDNEVTAAAVHAGLMRLEQLARQTGAAVAIGHPHDVTLDAVAAWLPTLAAKGLVLAPISAVVRARGTTGLTGLHTGASKG